MLRTIKIKLDSLLDEDNQYDIRAIQGIFTSVSNELKNFPKDTLQDRLLIDQLVNYSTGIAYILARKRHDLYLSEQQLENKRKKEIRERVLRADKLFKQKQEELKLQKDLAEKIKQAKEQEELKKSPVKKKSPKPPPSNIKITEIIKNKSEQAAKGEEKKKEEKYISRLDTVNGFELLENRVNRDDIIQLAIENRKQQVYILLDSVLDNTLFNSIWVANQNEYYPLFNLFLEQNFNQIGKNIRSYNISNTDIYLEIVPTSLLLDYKQDRGHLNTLINRLYYLSLPKIEEKKNVKPIEFNLEELLGISKPTHVSTKE